MNRRRFLKHGALWVPTLFAITKARGQGMLTLLSGSPPAAGPCATTDAPGSHSLLLEGFEGTGYENTWTVDQGSVDPNYATPAGGPTGSCSQSLRINSAGNLNSVSHDFTSGADGSVAVSFWFYANTMPNTESIGLMYMGADVYGSNKTLWIEFEDFGDKHLLLKGAANATGPVLAQSTWYQIGLRFNRNATSYLSVRDINGSAVGSEVSVTAADIVQQYLVFGNWTSKTLDRVYDVIQVDADGTKYTWQ
jgi:hypothetical protein